MRFETQWSWWRKSLKLLRGWFTCELQTNFWDAFPRKLTLENGRLFPPAAPNCLRWWSKYCAKWSSCEIFHSITDLRQCNDLPSRTLVPITVRYGQATISVTIIHKSHFFAAGAAMCKLKSGQISCTYRSYCRKQAVYATIISAAGHRFIII